MRTTLETLREQVIIEARNFANGTTLGHGLVKAVLALDAYVPSEITGEGALANRNAPDTAHEAAALAHLVQNSVRHKIVQQLAQTSSTDEELEWSLSGKHQTVSSARNWLVKTGWVRDSGHRRFTQFSRMPRRAVVWELTPLARLHISKTETSD